MNTIPMIPIHPPRPYKRHLLALVSLLSSTTFVVFGASAVASTEGLDLQAPSLFRMKVRGVETPEPPTKKIKVTNRAKHTIVIAKISLAEGQAFSLPAANEAGLFENLPLKLKPGDSTEIEVRFGEQGLQDKPSHSDKLLVAAYREGSLVVENQEVPLLGVEHVGPRLQCDYSGALFWQHPTAPQKEPTDVRCTNTGDEKVQLSKIHLENENKALVVSAKPLGSKELSPGESMEFLISAYPKVGTSEGRYTAQLLFSTNDPEQKERNLSITVNVYQRPVVMLPFAEGSEEEVYEKPVESIDFGNILPGQSTLYKADLVSIGAYIGKQRDAEIEGPDADAFAAEPISASAEPAAENAPKDASGMSTASTEPSKEQQTNPEEKPPTEENTNRDPSITVFFRPKADSKERVYTATLKLKYRFELDGKPVEATYVVSLRGQVEVPSKQHKAIKWDSLLPGRSYEQNMGVDSTEYPALKTEDTTPAKFPWAWDHVSIEGPDAALFRFEGKATPINNPEDAQSFGRSIGSSRTIPIVHFQAPRNAQEKSYKATLHAQLTFHTTEGKDLQVQGVWPLEAAIHVPSTKYDSSVDFGTTPSGKVVTKSYAYQSFLGEESKNLQLLGWQATIEGADAQSFSVTPNLFQVPSSLITPPEIQIAFSPASSLQEREYQAIVNLVFSWKDKTGTDHMKRIAMPLKGKATALPTYKHWSVNLGLWPGFFTSPGTQGFFTVQAGGAWHFYDNCDRKLTTTCIDTSIGLSLGGGYVGGTQASLFQTNLDGGIRVYFGAERRLALAGKAKLTYGYVSLPSDPTQLDPAYNLPSSHLFLFSFGPGLHFNLDKYSKLKGLSLYLDTLLTTGTLVNTVGGLFPVGVEYKH